MLTLGAAGAAGGQMGILIFIVIMFVGMYFISIRPQKKQQQKRQAMLKEMQEGDNVVTLGGLKGVIHEINRENKEVIIDCDGVYLTFDLNFIRRSSHAGEVVNDAKNDKSVEDKAAEKTEETPAPAEETKADDQADATETSTDDAATDETKDETK